jgi:hypothetical protein
MIITMTYNTGTICRKERLILSWKIAESFIGAVTDACKPPYGFKVHFVLKTLKNV